MVAGLGQKTVHLWEGEMLVLDDDLETLLDLSDESLNSSLTSMEVRSAKHELDSSLGGGVLQLGLVNVGDGLSNDSVCSNNLTTQVCMIL